MRIYDLEFSLLGSFVRTRGGKRKSLPQDAAGSTLEACATPKKKCPQTGDFNCVLRFECLTGWQAIHLDLAILHLFETNHSRTK
jgi:hypothetical protein